MLAECIRTPSTMPLEQRLLRIHRELRRMIDEVRPAAVAVERVLFSGNVRTAMPTGQAAGVALLVAAEHDLPVVAYSPNEVKQTVTGDGAADKGAVARLVTIQLGLAEAPKPVDVTDALAVAITHLAHSRGPAAAAIATPARAALRAAEEQSRAAASGGWEAVVSRRPARGDAA
jgi:crossover junction endodeoxyribonuclease RuvC